MPRPFQHARRWPSAQWQWGQWDRASKFCSSRDSRTPFKPIWRFWTAILTCLLFFSFPFFPVPWMPRPQRSLLPRLHRQGTVCGFPPSVQTFAFFYQMGKIQPGAFITSWGRRWRITVQRKYLFNILEALVRLRKVVNSIKRKPLHPPKSGVWVIKIFESLK